MEAQDSGGQEPVSTKQQQITEYAEHLPEPSFIPLTHNIDIEWMYHAWMQTRKDGAKGVDGQGSEEFATNLGKSIKSC